MLCQLSAKAMDEVDGVLRRMSIERQVSPLNDRSAHTALSARERRTKRQKPAHLLCTSTSGFEAVWASVAVFVFVASRSIAHRSNVRRSSERWSEPVTRRIGNGHERSTDIESRPVGRAA